MTATAPGIAVAIVEELMRAGVRDAVLAPGSRSAPLALALADAERQGLLRLHVRIDERSAAYLALGIARESGRACAVVTTSGTAAVNLHPAVVEAAYSGVPLIVLTADRPGALRGSGANQTIDQRRLFGVDVVADVDLEELAPDGVRTALAEAIGAAMGPGSGPVHVNVPLAEPLVAAGQHRVGQVEVVERVAARPVGRALSQIVPTGVDVRHGVLVAGDFDDDLARERAGELADALGWPIISEPSGNLSDHPRALRHGPMLLRRALELDATPEVVVTVGRVGLHRSVTALLRATPVHIAVDVPPRRGRVDPARTAVSVVDAVPVPDGAADDAWWTRWQGWDRSAAEVIDAGLGGDQLSGPVVARMVGRAATGTDLIYLGPSWPVRHVSSYAGALRARCLGNRGTSGIDGVVSSAWGAAVALGDRDPGATAYALVGDLTAIYDRNGLLAPASEARPRLVYVVADNDGGGIFSSLEQGEADFADDFERVFGTPHGADVADLLSAPLTDVTTVDTPGELARELERSVAGVRVIVARCISRDAEARLVARIADEVDDAIR